MTLATSGSTARDALEGSVGALAAAGVEAPRLDAELLLCEATGWERASLAADPDREVDPGAAREFAAMVRRRLRREPLAYITGRKGFRRIELAVAPGVLIPRPETELLVDVALELAPATVLDVGTGSGAVALAIADELPAARVTATDTSEPALEQARSNAVRLGLADRVTFEPGALAAGEFELIVANLPYVAEDDWEALAPEIREFEPREALLAGADGLGAIRELLAAPVPAEAIALEVGAGQADAVSDLVRGAGFGRVEARRDMVGIERVVIGR